MQSSTSTEPSPHHHHDDNDEDRWKSTANLYSSQAARVTQVHGADLVTMIKDDILRAKTILDIGCGTGAFALAYMQQFPSGVPGQTLILSDLSPGMLEKAKEAVLLQRNSIPPDFQTKIVFQEEDGTKLDGIHDDSIEIVVSLFGVFLIPDQEATMRAIKRVLKKTGGAASLFANASWAFGLTPQLAAPSVGLGVSLQDAFRIPKAAIDKNPPCFPGEEKENDNKSAASSGILDWSDLTSIQKLLVGEHGFETASISRAIHTSVWEFDMLWDMLLKNPMSGLVSAPEEDAKRAKEALEQFVSQDGTLDLKTPLSLFSVSNLAVARGVVNLY